MSKAECLENVQNLKKEYCLKTVINKTKIRRMQKILKNKIKGLGNSYEE